MGLHLLFSHSVMSDSATPGTAALQASLSSISLSLLKLMSFNHLSSLSPSAFNLPQHQVFPNKSALHIRWPKYWSFGFNISPSNEYSGLISFKIDWHHLLAVQGTAKNFDLKRCYNVRKKSVMESEQVDSTQSCFSYLLEVLRGIKWSLEGNTCI